MELPNIRTSDGTMSPWAAAHRACSFAGLLSVNLLPALFTFGSADAGEVAQIQKGWEATLRPARMRMMPIAGDARMVPVENREWCDAGFYHALDRDKEFCPRTYWVAVGGQNPMDVLKELGSRVIALRIKDAAKLGDEVDQVAVGAGILLISASPPF
jgi:hypothetical protein